MKNNQLKLHNIVNIEELKILFESFTSATGFTTGLVEQETNEVLIGTGWRDICTRFHRINPDSVAHCKASNQELTANLSTSGEIRISHCQNGLIDGCTPLIIEGKHLANIFTGQVLFASPDINFFKKQIHQYNYDQDPYLKSLSEVPVVNEETFRAILLFLSQISMMIANSGLAKLKSRESEERLNTIFEATSDGILVADAKSKKITTANKAGCLMLGYSLEEIQSLKVADLHPSKDAPFVIEQFAKQLKSEITIAQDIPVKRKDESIFYADISSSLGCPKIYVYVHFY